MGLVGLSSPVDGGHHYELSILLSRVKYPTVNTRACTMYMYILMPIRNAHKSIRVHVTPNAESSVLNMASQANVDLVWLIIFELDVTISFQSQPDVSN